jgi:hypothetical protein
MCGSILAGNWERVSGYLAETLDSQFETMAVFLTDTNSAANPDMSKTVTSGHRQYIAPFSMNQICLAMLRILEQKDREGVKFLLIRILVRICRLLSPAPKQLSILALLHWHRN